jgi:hypothetical protein
MNDRIKSIFGGNKTGTFMRVLKKAVIILVNEYNKQFYGLCKISVSFTYIFASFHSFSYGSRT